MGQGPFVRTVALLTTFWVEHGLERLLYWFFFFIFGFSVPQFTYVSVCMCVQYSDPRRHPCPTYVLGKEVVYKRLAEWNVKQCVSNYDAFLWFHQDWKLIMTNLKILLHKNEKKRKKGLSYFTAPKQTQQDWAWLQVLTGIRQMSCP